MKYSLSSSAIDVVSESTTPRTLLSRVRSSAFPSIPFASNQLFFSTTRSISIRSIFIDAEKGVA